MNPCEQHGITRCRRCARRERRIEPYQKKAVPGELMRYNPYSVYGRFRTDPGPPVVVYPPPLRLPSPSYYYDPNETEQELQTLLQRKKQRDALKAEIRREIAGGVLKVQDAMKRYTDFLKATGRSGQKQERRGQQLSSGGGGATQHDLFADIVKQQEKEQDGTLGDTFDDIDFSRDIEVPVEPRETF